MSLFTLFSGMLGDAAGKNQINDPTDVRTTKTNLQKAGYFPADDKKDNDNPFLTRKMDEGIKKFQKDNNLKIDGVMKPSGETERTLYERLTGKNADNVLKIAQNDTGTVGFGGNVSGTLPPVPKKNPHNTKIDTPPIPERKPETISPTKKGNEILDFIGKIESSNNYNIIVGGKEKPLTKMTIKEVRQIQRERNNQNLGTAVGRYQIIDDKMDDLIRWMNLDTSAILDENLQDQMGRELLRRRGYEKFKASTITTKQFIRELSKEWASFPKDESNQSYYKGVGNNKALTDFKTLKELLEKK
tara:strand:+ start:9126 stop:10028 length:903 start_codon:yes stop_codon:yes gene_type:complete